MAGPFVSLLTDFGARDPSAAILHGVILSIEPDARIVDISHEVRKFAIRDGALLLWCALPYLPVGLHVAVVDPGVGTQRRPVAIRTGRGDVLIGPDNGLLVGATSRLGGIASVRLLEAPEYRLPVVSTSFHGRDIFAPAAAHLARGVSFEALGEELDPTSLVASPIVDPVVEPSALRSSIVYIDTFGNVKLAGLRADLESALGRVQPGDALELTFEAEPDRESTTVAVPWLAAFGDIAVGGALLYEDSYGRICLAENQGDVAARLGLVEDRRVTIRRA
jgi:S-adenosylmethionine hydrolase